MRGLVLFLTMVAATSATAEDVVVRAPSSLRVALPIASQDFSDAGVESLFSGSQTLALQVNAGAEADLMILADTPWMQTLVEHHNVAGDPTALLSNQLVVCVRHNTKNPPKTLQNLHGLSLAIAGPAVPLGRYTRQALILDGADATPLIDSAIIASSATATLALLTDERVDAAVLYRSDAVQNEGIKVAFPLHTAEPITYWAALTPRGQARPEARALLRYLASDSAQDVFIDAGFSPPVGPLRPAGPLRGAAIAESVDLWGSVWRSIWVAAIAIVLITPPALLLGTWLARASFFGKSLVSTALLLPLVLPPVVTGYALLEVFGQNGLLSPILSPFGLEIAFTRWATVVAAAVVGFPLLILMVRTAIEGVDPRYEQMSKTLGHSRGSTWLRVTLPLAWPGLLAGWVLAFARALGEFGATAIFAGDRPSETRTLALAVYALYEQPGGQSGAWVLAGVSAVICFASLVAYERLNTAQRRRASGR